MNYSDLPAALPATAWDRVENCPTFQAAKTLHETIRDSHHHCVAECPKWISWHDQAQRSSMSVLLNYSEAQGRLRGHWLNAMLIARGEAYEVAAALQIGPKLVCDPLKEVVKRVIDGINAKIRSSQE